MTVKIAVQRSGSDFEIAAGLFRGHELALGRFGH